MAPPVEISIPSTTLSSNTSKTYTLYNITLRLPLRTFVVQKRYSEFADLHAALSSAASSPPPASLPAKSWFRSTSSSPELTEARRVGLEAYLRAIAESPDRRWRETSVWRGFLNLPSSTAGSSASAGAGGLGSVGVMNQVAGDPVVWLDVLRELKGLLQSARMALGKRDGAATAQAAHEAGANAKKLLVKAGTLLGSLDEGLKAMAEEGGRRNGGGGATKPAVGEGELRRRKDLLASARVEKEGLEKLCVSLAAKSQSEGESATTTTGNGTTSVSSQQQHDKSSLFGPGVARPPTSGRRVLGAPPIPETAATRALDNEGVLQLQKQIMRDQDLDVDELAKIVRRQRDMGVAIHEELEDHIEMLKRVDEDAERVRGKIEVAKKRIGKIK